MIQSDQNGNVDDYDETELHTKKEYNTICIETILYMMMLMMTMSNNPIGTKIIRQRHTKQ